MMLIGHELNTPLHSIHALIDEGQNSAGTLNKDTIWKDLNYASEKLKRHIENLLTLAESNESTGKAVPTECFLPSLFQNLSNDLTHHFFADEPPKITIERSSVPETLLLDCRLFQKVIFELAENAIRYSNDHSVRIELNYINSRLKVDIIDNGPGMPIKMLDEFKQGQSGFNRKYEGLGIGLAVVSKIVSILNASIKIVSPGKIGTTIRIELDAALVYNSDKLKIKTSHSHCLVAEDNEVNQKVLVRMLERLNYSVDTANNGYDAVKMTDGQDYNFILMDLQMPIMDGFKATKLIRKNGFSGPIYAVTANTDQTSKNNAIKAGMDGVIGKPIRLATLEDFLSRTMIGLQ